MSYSLSSTLVLDSGARWGAQVCSPMWSRTQHNPIVNPLPSARATRARVRTLTSA